MTKKLKTIIKEIFIENKIEKLEKTLQSIKDILGENFIKKHIQHIFQKHNKIIIETKTIEAKTELNVLKKKL